MGRVYDALKRAAEANGAKAKDTNGAKAKRDAAAIADEVTLVVEPAAANGGERSNGGAAHAPVAAVPTPEHLFESSRHFRAPEAAHVSAPNERTEPSVGSALPDGLASRVAGATLGAAGSARAGREVQSLDITAARVEPHLVAVTQPNSPHAERFRSLRTRVLHAGERRKMQAFVITSAGVMEGKTLTAANLAWFLAQTDGVRALLIDGDLRNPCAADYLGVDAPTGLAEILAGEATLAESVLRLEPAGLYLLPGGEPRANVAELLSGPRFSAVLKEVRQMFDYIIIDAPPLGVFTDASVLINRADAALIVARAGRTRYSALDRLLEPLQRERILGVVLNGSDEQPPERYDYYNRRRYARRAEAVETVTETFEE